MPFFHAIFIDYYFAAVAAALLPPLLMLLPRCAAATPIYAFGAAMKAFGSDVFRCHVA